MCGPMELGLYVGLHIIDQYSYDYLESLKGQIRMASLKGKYHCL